MANSILLNIPEPAASQAQPFQVVADGFSAFERSFNDYLELTLTADVTVTENQQVRNFVIACKGVTADRILYLSDTVGTINLAKRFICVRSDSANTGNVKVRMSGTTNDIITISPGGAAFIQVLGSTAYVLGVYSLSSNNPSLTYDISIFTAGQPPSGSVELYRFTATQNLTFNANFSGSRGSARVPATSNYTMVIQKNGTTVGDVTFQSGGTVVFSTVGGSPVTLAPGDNLTVLSQAGSDATLADTSVVLLASK